MQKPPVAAFASLSKIQHFDRLAEVKEAVKASNSLSSAYGDTVEGELRSKSKRLAKQGITGFYEMRNIFFCCR